jgi:hypothetical protein
MDEERDGKVLKRERSKEGQILGPLVSKGKRTEGVDARHSRQARKERGGAHRQKAGGEKKDQEIHRTQKNHTRPL